MKNEVFQIGMNAVNGGVGSIRRNDDKDAMNWVTDEKTWGLICSTNKKEDGGLELINFQEDESYAVSEYSNDRLLVRVDRFFTDNGNFCERYTITNTGAVDLFLEQNSFGITLPFSDQYTYADDCMINHCNTHIWCAYNCTYVYAIKMGVSDLNLGLVLKKGAIASYSVADLADNNRGTFIFNIAHTELLPGESTVIEWELFTCSSREDFCKKMRKYDTYTQIDAVHFTVFEGEKIEFKVRVPQGMSDAKVFYDAVEVETETENGVLTVSCPADRLGKHRFWIRSEKCAYCTYADFYVSLPFDQLVKKRLDFIIDRQQYHREGSKLDGAFLIYDNEEEHVIFDDSFVDHNACRERIGMALLLAEYLRHNEWPKGQKALEQYVEFMYREFFDCGMGTVYTTVGRGGEIRLYNAPWVAVFLSELYELTKKKKYLDDLMKLLERYFQDGGSRFYPNAFTYLQIYETFIHAKRTKDAGRIKEMFEVHVGNMAKNGTSYPKHEVNYEQTIVSPAAYLTTELGILTGKPRWKKSARMHIEILERFNGHQPSCHLYEIPIRYWDDYWFGKRKQRGDTFPHYWSCLSARAFLRYYQLSGEERYHIAAQECMRNCLCLFDENGHGSCAYVYPYKVENARGQFYDEWANDQDFALYFALKEKTIFM